MRNKLKALPILIALAVTAACIHKSSGTVTPWEKVTTANAVLAQSINAVAQGTIAVQSAGLISKEEAAPVLNFTARASEDQLEINKVLADKPDFSNIPKIQTFIDSIGQSAQAVVNSGAAGVKNPKSQQTISADIKAVVDSANLILSNYKAAVGGAQ